ncbi:hypothetical protein PNA2_1912 [Pyrococcus sp. NA2]|uniref:prenyltransferase/squalene oxidase repeat-containing protein n=1 Tax=Pyrococcus sp. (strain NA2) TaxID=342949 RepID=UPI000209AD84|nr:prenyltransferase/squalene oxidase repeat-containing protein [Pyrococcus sp. NA2]AEC52826.1 hypothetical protein PNA2_1912 [Pyrococcus sp. NA2]
MRVFTYMLILLIITATPASAINMLDYSVDMVKKMGELSKTKDLSLMIFALSLAFNRSENLTTEDVWKLVDLLIERQNSDGGWGYFYGSISSVPDTSFALIGLSKAKGVFYNDINKRVKIEKAVRRGIIYLKEAFNGEGWGYLPGMPSDYRSTLLASAALSMLGEGLSYVSESYNVIRDEIPDDPFMVYLWILVTKTVTGEIPEKAIEKLKEMRKDEGELAASTYALLEFEGLTFDTAMSLLELEEYRETWSDPYYPIYTAMAFSLVSEKRIRREELSEICSILSELQNGDGGWGVYSGVSSNVMVTYYVLNSFKRCNPKSETVKKALHFMRIRMQEIGNEVKMDRHLRKEYLYALLSLIEYNNLTKSEKEEAISLIMSSTWKDNLGKQPVIVALAVKALLELGIPSNSSIIEENLKWLEKMKIEGGWGFTFETPYVEWYLAPTYPETVEVFNALLPILGRDRLKDTIELMKKEAPTVEWVKLYTYTTLLKLREKPSWEVDIPSNYKRSPLLDAMLIRYYTLSPEVAWTNIHTVFSEFMNRKIEIRTMHSKLGILISRGLAATLNSNTKLEVVRSIVVPETGYYVIVAPIGEVDPSVYNRRITIQAEAGKVTIDGIPLNGEGNLVIIPGENREGALLFVLYNGKNVDRLAEIMFDPRILRYLHGKAVIVRWYDRNNDGEVEMKEIDVKFL